MDSNVKKSPKKGAGFWIIVFIILLGTISVLWDFAPAEQTSYSDIIKLFESEQVKAFAIDGNELQLKLRDEKETVIAYDLPSIDVFLYDLGDTIKAQRASGVIEQQDYIVQTMSWWMSLLPYLVIIVIFGAFWFFMMKKQDGGAGGAMSFGKSKAKLATDDNRKVTFKDVAGADEEKSDLEEIVGFLKDPNKFLGIGARIPKGVLLVGPPGTGKTLIAKAVAGEAGVPFFSISGSDFVELYVGVGASRVRSLFEDAKKSAPAIVFIDEIDAVGRQRGAGVGGGHDEREQTLNQLLVEMDGFGNNVGVIVIAATNRADILDPALLRPGRFDRQIYIGVPDIKGRAAILKVHSAKKPFADDVDFNDIARTTVGFTGADLENLLNEAALLAARRNKEKISQTEINEAFFKVIMGTEKKSRVISEAERKITAYHEAGHAVSSKLLPSQDPVQHISIIPRGRAGGFTLNLPTEDKYYASKNEMQDELVVLLGGRVAEKLVLNDISTGASNDIERASEIARNMVTKYGMSDKIGPISFGSAHDEVFLGRDFTTAKHISDSTAAIIDNELKSMINDAYVRCEKLLGENMEVLHRVAKYLLEFETMSGEEFTAIFDGKEPPTHIEAETANNESVAEKTEEPTENETK